MCLTCVLFPVIACCLTAEESCAALASASNPSSPLKELNLNLNEPGDSGVKQHSALLENPHCTLEEPQQEHCRIIPEGRAGLSSALRSNPSSYPRELNLNYNEPGDSGVKPISDLLEDPHCKLEKLEIIAKGHPSLSLALRSNPSSLLREKNLNFSEPGDSGVKQLSDLLEDHHRELEKRHQEHRRMIAEGRAEMRSNFSSHLREMNNSFPGISGFSDLLEDPHCTMEKLRQEHRRMIAEGRAEMRSNFSSHLREMNNSFPGISGLKHFSDLLEDPHCTMEKLHQEHRRMIAEGRAEMSMWTPHTLSGHGTPEPVITNRPITSRFMPRNLHTPPEFDTHTPNHFTHSYTSERVYRNVKWPPS
ncbi:uncharacterized protein LOC143481760 [Brachyhypopomus gauderio]|uniref:uncharacterized protein LOC143481760 n=1 Tax=Brachyhypopomus gauderio TaxID=698409 RepID=UPI004040ECBD